MYIRSFTKIVDEAVCKIKAALGNIISITLLTWLIVLGMGIGSCIIAGVFLVVLEAAQLKTSIFSVLLEMIPCILIITSILTGLYIGTGAFIILANPDKEKTKMVAIEAIGKSIKKIMKYWGYALLQLAVIIPIGLILLILARCLTNTVTIAIFSAIGKMIKFIFTSALESMVGSVLLVLILVTLIVLIVCAAIIVIETFFIYGIPGIVLDDLGPIQAFTKGIKFLKGEFWQTFKKIWLYRCGMLGLKNCCNVMISVVTVIIMSLVNVFGGNATLAVVLLYFLQIGFMAVCNLILAGIAPNIAANLYISEKCKKEGEDLRQRLQSLKLSEMNKESMAYES